MTIAELLRGAQAKKKLTNRKAAEAIGCDKNSYGPWVRGLWPPGPEWTDALAAFTGKPEIVIREAILREHAYIKENESLVVNGRGKGGKKRLLLPYPQRGSDLHKQVTSASKAA